MKTKTPVIENRKARYDYFVEDTLECGISLRGNEVKSLLDGQCSIKEAWCQIQNSELVIRGMHISKWNTANTFDVDEDRERVLLAHKQEIRKLESKVSQEGITLIPLKVYFAENTGRCKVLVGICKGKKNYDKRDSLKSAQIKRDISRAIKTF